MNGSASAASGVLLGPCVLVPIKQREHCKTRLAAALAPRARLVLVQSMLAAVLAAARAARTVREVMVVSPERCDAVPAGMAVLTDAGESLNDALGQACATLWQRGWREFVILPADLPCIEAAEIDALVRAGGAGGFALAADTGGTGTNALYLASTPSFQFQFGPGSRDRHLQEAQRLGLAPRLLALPGLAFDVDTPADLLRWRAAQAPARPAALEMNRPWPSPEDSPPWTLRS